MVEKILKFSSLAEQLRYCQTSKVYARNESSQDTGARAEEFAASRDWEHAVQLMQEGTEYTAKLAEASIALNSQTQHLRQTSNMYYDITGDVLDIGKHLTGQPEVYMNFESESQPAPQFIRLHVSMVASWKVESSAIIARGAAIANIIDILEEAGIRVELKVSVCSVEIVKKTRAIKRRFITETIVKREQDALNLNILGSVLHTAYMRRIWFRSIECTKEAAPMASTHYGFCIDAPHQADQEYFFQKISPEQTKYNFGPTWIEGQLTHIKTFLTR